MKKDPIKDIKNLIMKADMNLTKEMRNIVKEMNKNNINYKLKYLRICKIKFIDAFNSLWNGIEDLDSDRESFNDDFRIFLEEIF